MLECRIAVYRGYKHAATFASVLDSRNLPTEGRDFRLNGRRMRCTKMTFGRIDNKVVVSVRATLRELKKHKY
jgi:hypothetical protein